MNQPWSLPCGFWAVPVFPATARSECRLAAAVPRSTTAMSARRSPSSCSALSPSDARLRAVAGRTMYGDAALPSPVSPS